MFQDVREHVRVPGQSINARDEYRSTAFFRNPNSFEVTVTHQMILRARRRCVVFLYGKKT